MRAFTVTAAAALQVDVSSHEQSPLGALQAQFAAVEQQIKTAGRITPGVYSTVQKLQKMVTSIIEPAILESHAADQLLVLTVFREIISCDATYQKFLKGDKMAALAALKGVKTEFDHCGGSVEELKEKFAKCMDDRDVLVRHNNTVCCQEFAICSSPTGYGDCEIVKLEQGFAGCDYKAMTGEECFAHAKAMVEPLSGYFTNQDKKYEAVRFECAKFSAATKAKVAECAYLQEAVNAKVHETNEFAEQFNEAARKTEENCRTACSEYKECRAKTVAAYLKVVGPCEADNAYGSGGDCVKNRETDRKSEWEATQTISCLLKHYCDGGHFDEKNVEECKATIDAYHLAVTYPKVPEELPCEIPDCGACPGCDECLDRPYYQYETPCYATPLGEAPACMEEPECPEWCAETAEPKPTAAPVHLTFFFGSALPAGKKGILDTGKGYSQHGALTYGWNCDGDNKVDYSGGRRGTNRGGGLGLNHFDRSNTCRSGSEYLPVNFEVAVPNGEYKIHVNFGDEDVDSTQRMQAGCALEGEGVCDGSGKCIVDKSVTVTDGRLTVTGYGHDSSKCHSISELRISN